MQGKSWSWNALFGLLLLLGGLLLLVRNLFPLSNFDSWVWSGLLLLSGLLFFYLWATQRSRWWALLPAGVLTSLAAVTLLSHLPGSVGHYAGPVFLLGLSATFFAVYLANRSYRWSLIPSGILLLLACSSLLSELPFVPENWRPALGGSLFLAGLGAGFLVIPLFRKELWWPILPGGFLLVLATLPVLSTIDGLSRWIPLALFGGAALVFLALHLATRTRWSLWAAGATFAAGFLIQMLSGPDWFSGSLAGLVLIALGVLLLLRRASPR